MLTVAGATQEQVREAIKNSDFRDFEDCLQDECAICAGADYIVTCNIKDFRQAKTSAVTPDVFVKMLNGL